MKKILLTVALSAAVLLSFSQEKPLSLGIKAGMGYSNYDVELGYPYTDKDAKLGYRFGVVAEYQLSNDFFLQSGIDILSKGMKSSFLEIDDIDGDGIKGDRMWGKMTWNAVYLEVPVMFGYQMNISDGSKIKFMAGPYVAYGIGGKISAKANSQKGLPGGFLGDVDYGKDKANLFSKETVKRFDMGLIGAIGAEYNKFIFTVGYEYGLTNISQGSNSIHNMNAFATVGYKLY